MPAEVIEDLTEEECSLLAIMQDTSGLDLAEFAWHDPDAADGCWRAWPFQWEWFRDTAPLQIDQMARSVGKTLSITLRMFAFPFLFPGQEAVITAPELVHLEPLTNLIENRFDSCRLGREMQPTGRGRTTHRPFMMNFVNGARIIGRIPQRDGKGVKGCLHEQALVMTEQAGYKQAKDIVIGDRVLTHEGRYAPVTAVYYDTNDCYEVEGQSSFPMIVSCDHRFYGVENLATPKQKRDFTDLGFHDVEFLTEHQVYWATPTKFPELPVASCEGMDLDNIYFWWLVGRYLADGWTSSQDRVMWCVPASKQPALTSAIEALGLRWRITQHSHSSGDQFTVNSVSWSNWLNENFGRLAGGKKLPAWLLGMNPKVRGAVLDGYLHGDGYFEPKKKRWEVGTASKELAMGVQLLAQSIGYTVNCTSVQPKVTEICGTKLKDGPQRSWRLQIGHGHPAEIGDYLVGKVKKVTPVGKQPIVNIVVDGDHSYLSGTIMSHNIHPIWLELDEAQDYPSEGWTELIETLKRGHPGAVWRAHGVTRGIRDRFYEFTQDTPTNQWKVHRITAMHRPNWTDQERQEKIQQYTSRDHPDYRRNVLGLHGDAQNPLFVLHRLMQVVDDDLSSEYNLVEYRSYRVTNEMLTDRGLIRDVTEFLDFSEGHRQRYKHFWAGMDVGYTNHPSEIIIAGEERVKMGEEPITRLRVVARIHLERISNPQQCKAIAAVMNFYNPVAYSMDKMQPVSEPVLTPSGWVPIGTLKVGDEVIGSNGKATKVTGVYPQKDRRVMRVRCSDGSWTRCGPEHLWTVKNIHQNAPVTVTTEQLARSMDHQKASESAAVARQRPWTIPMLSSPVEFTASARLPIDPYVLGLLLGDGNLRRHSIRFSSADPEILFELESRLPDGLVLKHEEGYDYTITTASGWRDTRAANGTYTHTNVLLAELRTLGLAGKLAHEKHIPISYLLASPFDRLAVLQGLMDTDGYVTPSGKSCTVAIRLTSKQMIDDIITIVESLGGSVRYRTHATSCKGKPGRQAYMATIHLPAHLSPFRLARKRDAVVPRTRRKSLNRYIASIEPDGEEESVCIRVEADDHLYVTRHHLLTHNTGVGLPLFQDLQEFNPKVAEQIKGYNFSEKILVDFDEAKVAQLREGEDDVKEAGIEKNVLEYATDSLRDLVDRKRWFMPWDSDLIGQFQGQTWSYSKEAMDMYGRRRRVYCVDEATKAFTRTGWKARPELVVGEEVLTLNPETGLSEWQPLLAVNSFDGPHEMLKMGNSKHSSQTTMDHRWLVDRYDAHQRQHVREWRTTASLTGSTQIITAAECADLPVVPKYTDDFVELSAWVFTEGHFERGRREEFSTLTIGQSTTANPEKVARIEACLVRLGGPGGPLAEGHDWARQVDRDNGMAYWRLSRDVTAEFRAVMDPRTKEVSTEFLLALSRTQLLRWIDTAIDGDGSRTPERVDHTGYVRGEHRAFTQAVEARARSFEFACVLAGVSTSFREPTAGSRQYRVGIHRTVHTNPKTPQSGGRGRADVEVVVHDGTVWCPTTANGTWLASRDGHVFFTGNSQGTFHALDGCRMLVLGYIQHSIEQMMAARRTQQAEPVFDMFVSI